MLGEMEKQKGYVGLRVFTALCLTTYCFQSLTVTIFLTAIVKFKIQNYKNQSL